MRLMDQEPKFFTLRTRVGNFVFPKETRFVLAKLVRDSVMSARLGQVHGINSNEVRDETSARNYMNRIGGPVSQVQFEWYPA